MDAVKFLEELSRMCKQSFDCGDCKLDGLCFILGYLREHNHIKCENSVETVEIVEKWAKDHPKKTRQSKFLKHYPYARLIQEKCIDVAPCHVDTENYNSENGTCAKYGNCLECMKQYWMEEID